MFIHAPVGTARNYRSEGLLRKLGFIPTKTEEVVRYGAEPDELVMIKSVRDSKPSHEHPQWGLFALPNE